MLNWDDVKKEYDELTQKLSGSLSDQRIRAELQKKSTKLALLLSVHDEVESIRARIEENKKLAQQNEFKELALEENRELEQELADTKKRLDDLLYPADERDNSSVFLEIRAGAGGQEAALFVSDLFKMYSTYALAKRWDVSLVETNTTDIGGYKELIAYIKGKGAYKHLKFESGVHRVQRVPETEGAGRIHTSTVTVAVLPEVADVEVNISPQDLRIDVFRAQGAGGQHVNTTDSAVRITHLPTGLVVSCQDERSQIKNKARAMKVLKARLFEMEKQKREAEISEKRKQQVGMGDRAEKIRTYNYPQNRVTDHRVNVTLKKLDLVMQGDLSDLIDPLLEWEMVERRRRGIVV
ncbi:peptide chain release factor 1 [Candidatus Dependentiae bacterium]|nr:peptide chain release factor 1 [Candidatus Dependentiae bacterium]